MIIKEQLEQIVQEAIRKAARRNGWKIKEMPPVNLVWGKNRGHGDWTTSVAFKLPEKLSYRLRARIWMTLSRGVAFILRKP